MCVNGPPIGRVSSRFQRARRRSPKLCCNPPPPAVNDTPSNLSSCLSRHQTLSGVWRQDQDVLPAWLSCRWHFPSKSDELIRMWSREELTTPRPGGRPSPGQTRGEREFHGCAPKFNGFSLHPHKKCVCVKAADRFGKGVDEKNHL